MGKIQKKKIKYEYYKLNRKRNQNGFYRECYS